MFGLAELAALMVGRSVRLTVDKRPATPGKPILEATQSLCGFPGVFENLPQIVVLMIAWLVVLVAFFVLAVAIGIVLLLGMTGVGYSTARGSLISRLTLTLVLVSFVNLNMGLSIVHLVTSGCNHILS